MTRAPSVLTLEAYGDPLKSDAELIHAVAEVDIVRLQWPPPARYLYVFLTLAPAHRLVVWCPEGNGPTCPPLLADRILQGPEDDFDWPVIYTSLMARNKRRRFPPAENFGHARGEHDIGTIMFLTLNGGHACPLRPEPPPPWEIAHLPELMRRLHPHMFSGPLSLGDWVGACPNEPWLHFWMGLYDHSHGRHSAALIHFARVLQQGLRLRGLAWFILQAAAGRGIHRLVRLCVSCLGSYAQDLPQMDALVRRYRGGAADTPSYPLLETVWQPDRIWGDDWRPLRALSGWQGLEEIRSVWLVGAHLASEYHSLHHLCPNLSRLVMFEPIPELNARLHQRFDKDRRVTILPYAASDKNGESDFHIANNQGLSSSFLPLGLHGTHQPEVTYERTITVPTRTLEEAAHQHRLPPPNLLILDVQGAEGHILRGLRPEFLAHVRVLFTEASKAEIYKGAQNLDELKGLLRQTHRFMGFFPIRGHHGKHGNALFISHVALGSTRAKAKQVTPIHDTFPPLEDVEMANLLNGIRAFFLSDFQGEHADPSAFRPIYIWGTGQLGQTLLPLLRGVDLPVTGFIDNNPDRWDTVVAALPVKNPDFLRDLKKKPWVVIASNARDEIETQLAGMNYTLPEDVIVPGFDILEIQ